ncbi:MFS transporter [Desulfobacter postgatei]|uniref:MFS transporter n=1 Tax=Desulfobacter postgatei TaxID=2293 RepID=UPI002A35E6B0|nr:MFS transporter [Desulfobacter postgatei]MDX9962404.1 MFS transporter [Desulfobacter postgatei]
MFDIIGDPVIVEIEKGIDEVRQVLCDHGMTLDIKVIRKLTYRYAERARAEQQAGRIPLNDGDTLEGRRVVISTDGGRTRLREKKRGPKTKKDRTRFRGAWREPKLLIIYDQVLTGQRREGRYIGLWSIAKKLSAALGVGIGLVLLAKAGYQPNAEQPGSAVFMLRVLYALVPCLCNILSIVIISFYPISKQAHAQIQREIGRL